MLKAIRVLVLPVALLACGGDAFSSGNRAAVIAGDASDPVGDAAGESLDEAGDLVDAHKDAAPPEDAWAHDDAQPSADGEADVTSSIDAGEEPPVHEAGGDVVDELPTLTPVCPYTPMCVQSITQAGMPFVMCDDAGQCPSGDCCSAWGSQGTVAIDDQCLPQWACPH